MIKDRGILARIRKRLGRGRTTTELIAEGFKPGSVYNARRQLLRRNGAGLGVQGTDEGPLSPFLLLSRSVEMISEEIRDLVAAQTGRPPSRLQQDQERTFAEMSLERAAVLARNEDLLKRVAELEPLIVWSGHPCAICHEPPSGIVARKTARKATKHFAHEECIERKQRESPLTFTFLNPEVPVRS